MGAKERRERKATPRGYLDFIDLTDDQRQKVEKIRERFLPRVDELRRTLRTQRLKLADALFASPFSRRKAKAIVAQISRLQLELELEVLDHIVEEKQLLTPEQQRQFHAVIVEQFSMGGLGVHGVPRAD